MNHPSVKQYTSLGWADEIPLPVSMTFVGVVLASLNGLAGEDMWEQIDKFVGSVTSERTKLGAMEREMEDKIESRFVFTHGAYERTTQAMVELLGERGLVIRGYREGLEVLDIPQVLPRPPGFTRSARACPETFTLKARPHGNGPKVRVEMGDLPEVQQLLDHGWSRHLPQELAAIFMIVAAVNTGRCIGDLMWLNIQDLYDQARRFGPPFLPPSAKRELAARFAEEYGKPYKKTKRGIIDVLVELGLITRYEREGQEALGVPESLPYPDERLNLNTQEKEILAARRKR